MTTAPSLLELQRAFSRNVFADDKVGLESWVEPQGLTAGERLQIYRNMVFNTLSGALKTSYPSVLCLVGADCFDGAAARYIAAVPSRSGNLQDFGEAFPDFLATMPETVELPYLADVARLEWARQESYLAAEARPIAPECLTSLGEEGLAGSVFALHPSVRLIDSHYPVLDIWRFCQEENHDYLRLGEHGQAVLVWRKGTQIVMQAISSSSCQFITGLLAGMPLGAAIGSAGAHDPRFDLSVNLHLLLQNDLLVDFHIVQRKS
ncbi:MAG: putative DNA-binding domain-containing protein [Pseudogulbenkiania sp.]|nr:putative DNA-binding domain-containing protein [Pseudogulbenkiania sp.]